MEVDITFTHPRASKTFLATVGLGLTARHTLLALLSPQNGFLQPLSPGSEYQIIIHRTGTAIPPQTTLGNAGVVDGDTLDIVLNAQAA
jgi:hypothetical protein